MKRVRLAEPSPLSWFGLLGAPFAWAVQHVFGIATTQARCGDLYREHAGVPMDTLVIAVSALALVVAVAGEAAAIAAWRRTRDSGDELPASRVRYVSVMGMTFSPLFVVIIAMSALGSILLPQCVQS